MTAVAFSDILRCGLGFAGLEVHGLGLGLLRVVALLTSLLYHGVVQKTFGPAICTVPGQETGVGLY